LQELTVQLSVGEADLGAYYRQVLDSMEPEIANIGTSAAVSKDCTHAAAPELAGSGPPSTMVVGSPHPGCACSTGGSPKDGALLVALVAFVLRRKSRAASRTRSPRA
jgi:MYXO-CTERM domain-containing protein